ncbi:hypothetical protein [Nocardiopsis sp. L17-MgMaSL7]|uniref:hypothetical protein n=1 Tax=Nocardiopsis sp. L17-MgMaSL7 TaxID=1938893 RepID=UPI000D9937E1|nr:hypothetical protein [Nocardiopsis sp. L17-MgMaSL7]PWV44607.1 hypothetical protein BDW27_12366 [Nocardiopsis sp. L17-MgMaSL7]
MRFPKKRALEEGGGPRWWLWRLAAEAARTLLAAIRTLLWLWRESGDGPGGR